MFKEYAKLDAQIKELEGKKEVMRLEIIKSLDKNEVTCEVTKYGTFTKANRTSYKYSDKVAALAEKVKLAKIREEEKGIATASVTNYLVFTTPKN